MQTRTLGTAGLEVSAIGLGCVGFSHGRGPVADHDVAVGVIRAAAERGVTFFDTAHGYGRGANERLLGEALAPFRGQVVIATKFSTVWDEAGNRLGFISRPEELYAAAEGSLRRLGVDSLDLYYLHRVNPDVPIEDIAGAVAELVAQMAPEVNVGKPMASTCSRSRAAPLVIRPAAPNAL